MCRRDRPAVVRGCTCALCVHNGACTMDAMGSAYTIDAMDATDTIDTTDTLGAIVTLAMGAMDSMGAMGTMPEWAQ